MVDFNFDNSEVLEKLKEFKEKGLIDALEKGLTNAALIIETQAKRKCPVDDGQLRQSITHNIVREKCKAEVGSNLEYAPYVEVGTGIYSSKGDGRKEPWVYQDVKGDWHTTRGRKPIPFLEDAASSSTLEILESFKELI